MCAIGVTDALQVYLVGGTQNTLRPFPGPVVLRIYWSGEIDMAVGFSLALSRSIPLLYFVRKLLRSW